MRKFGEESQAAKRANRRPPFPLQRPPGFPAASPPPSPPDAGVCIVVTGTPADARAPGATPPSPACAPGFPVDAAGRRVPLAGSPSLRRLLDFDPVTPPPLAAAPRRSPASPWRLSLWGAARTVTPPDSDSDAPPPPDWPPGLVLAAALVGAGGLLLLGAALARARTHNARLTRALASATHGRAAAMAALAAHSTAAWDVAAAGVGG